MTTTRKHVDDPAGLPPPEELIAAVRDAPPRERKKLLDAYAPAVDQLADAGTLAAWLGMKRATLYQERSRKNADGSPRWPQPDEDAGRSALWSYRTVVMHRAQMPGQGSAGRGRPRRNASPEDDQVS